MLTRSRFSSRQVGFDAAIRGGVLQVSRLMTRSLGRFLLCASPEYLNRAPASLAGTPRVRRILRDGAALGGATI